jgi:6-pyruvoyltetrahydropterin/6-carboxytetrahydropterin synthase
MPSAEAYSLMFLFIIDKIVQATEFNNGERNPKVYSVRVHETDTGYAESFRNDLEWWDFDLEDVVFSDAIKAEWKDPQMYDKLIEASKNGNKCFINSKVEQQV